MEHINLNTQEYRYKLLDRAIAKELKKLKQSIKRLDLINEILDYSIAYGVALTIFHIACKINERM